MASRRARAQFKRNLFFGGILAAAAIGALLFASAAAAAPSAPPTSSLEASVARNIAAAIKDVREEQRQSTNDWWDSAPPREEAAAVQVDVVFVLDTTGSMSGLIEGAKEKIFTIARAIAQTESSPPPVIRFGLIGYRDRGDDYVTRATPLSSDLDLMYEQLLAETANGGGDFPESVNQALHEAVARMNWATANDDQRLVKMVFLVGDAPAHTDYQDDPMQYGEVAALAADESMVINTILCGNHQAAKRQWREIAAATNGEFFKIDQSGGVKTYTTPYDEKVNTLRHNLRGSGMAFGTRAAKDAWIERQVHESDEFESASVSSRAARASYLATAASGKAADAVPNDVFTLVDDESDLEAVSAVLDSMAADELPDELAGAPREERARMVEERAEERARIEGELLEAIKQRDDYIAEQREKDAHSGSGFDDEVISACQTQLAKLADETVTPVPDLEIGLEPDIEAKAPLLTTTASALSGEL